MTVSGVVVIRDRTADDLPALVDVLAEVARADGYPSRWPEDPAAWIRTADALAAWTAVRDGQTIGQVVLRRAGRQRPVSMWSQVGPADPSTCAVVARLFVHPAARGSGAGPALLEAAWSHAHDRGMRAVLDVVGTNRQAVRLYRRLGWMEIGTYEEVFHEGGRPEKLYCFAAPARMDNERTAMR